MVGGIKDAARSAFSSMLREPLDPKEREQVQLNTLDEGVSGYVFDTMPLRIALLSGGQKEPLESLTSPTVPHRPSDDSVSESIASLIQSSLEDLPENKPRLVNTALSPHEMLVFIREVGIDLFDSFWVQQAATWGVALDFRFPAPLEKKEERCHIGHNLYDTRYANDFSRLADAFLDGVAYSKQSKEGEPSMTVCPCASCSPTWTNDPLIHSTVDEVGTKIIEPAPPYSRAYIHHLLHTHEMSAHALLVMHNLSVLDAFLKGVREVIERDQDAGDASFAKEVEQFFAVYDSTFELLDEAKASYLEVDLARGKGRLARERENEAAKTAEELHVPAPTVDVVEDVMQG